jgi:hypothetical protein
MSSAFFDIQTALIAALSSATALAGGRIYANRLRPITANQASAIVVRLDQAQGTEMVIGSVEWSTAYAVECYARAASGTDPAAAVDALLLDAWARLAALDFTALDAVISINPQIDWQYDDAETPVVCAVMRLTAQHRTNLAALT